MKALTQIRRLTIKNFCLTNKAANILLDSGLSNLESLNLNQCRIEKEGAEHVTALISANKDLKHVILSKNNFEFKLKGLLGAASNLQGLETLDLSENNFE
jgi:Ran GTPase-activating protein (RanGAP) involved in mRNA processing and transport